VDFGFVNVWVWSIKWFWELNGLFYAFEMKKKIGRKHCFFILAVAHSVCDHGAFKLFKSYWKAMNHGFKGMINVVLFW
jgi:hypothetical protein